MEHIGIDLGKRESQICVRSSDGAVLDEQRWPTASLSDYLRGRAHSRVILETSSEAFAIADVARECGHEVRVVPATLVRSLGVAARGIKNDRRDARATSEASCRVELPTVHIPSKEARELRAMCTSRSALVESRTKLVNTVRSWMRCQITSVRTGTPSTFPKRVREKLLSSPEGLPQHIERILVVLESLTAEIHAADKELKRLTDENEVCHRLMTAPGVGTVTSARFVAAVDQVSRFANAHQLESYFGMTPGENVTGYKGHRTRLTKAGQAQVRFSLVQAAWCAMRTRPTDPMVMWAMQVAERRGRPIAAVALARKLAGILYAMWRDGTNYVPSRGASTPSSQQ